MHSHPGAEGQREARKSLVDGPIKPFLSKPRHLPYTLFWRGKLPGSRLILGNYRYFFTPKSTLESFSVCTLIEHNASPSLNFLFPEQRLDYIMIWRVHLTLSVHWFDTFAVHSATTGYNFTQQEEIKARREENQSWSTAFLGPKKKTRRNILLNPRSLLALSFCFSSQVQTLTFRNPVVLLSFNWNAKNFCCMLSLSLLITPPIPIFLSRNLLGTQSPFNECQIAEINMNLCTLIYLMNNLINEFLF